MFPESLGPYGLSRFTEALRGERIVELHLIYSTPSGERIDAVAYVNKAAYTYRQDREAMHAALLDHARAQVPVGLLGNLKEGCKPC